MHSQESAWPLTLHKVSKSILVLRMAQEVLASCNCGPFSVSVFQRWLNRGEDCCTWNTIIDISLNPEPKVPIHILPDHGQRGTRNCGPFSLSVFQRCLSWGEERCTYKKALTGNSKPIQTLHKDSPWARQLWCFLGFGVPKVVELRRGPLQL